MKCWPVLFTGLAAFALGLWAAKASRSTPPPISPKIRFYQDSMHPWVKSDHPGACPVCRMKLTPILEGDSPSASAAGLVTLSPEAVTVAHVAAEPVLRRDIHRVLRVSGTLEAQETRTAVVAAPAAGRVDFIAIDHPGMEIQQGQTLIRLFSPDLAQRSRFLRVTMSNQPAGSATAAKVPGHGGAGGGMPNSGVTSENAGPTVGGYRLELFMSDLTAPLSGIVSERPVTLGQYVTEGQRIATVIDPSVLWFRFDAAERQLGAIAPGQCVRLRTEAAPGQTWIGTVAFLEPVYDELRRLAKLRAAVTNNLNSGSGAPAAMLRPGMMAEGEIAVVFANVLAVPKAAVIYPGSSAWVYVAHAPGTYERRRVCLGREGDDGWEVLSGLEEREQVVTTGNVLLDAQATFENGQEDPSDPAERSDDDAGGASASAASEPGGSPSSAVAGHPQ